MQCASSITMDSTFCVNVGGHRSLENHVSLRHILGNVIRILYCISMIQFPVHILLIKMRRIKILTHNTVGSKIVAMFENFGLGGVWHLGAWDSCLVLGESNKVFHLGFQMSYISCDLN